MGGYIGTKKNGKLFCTANDYREKNEEKVLECGKDHPYSIVCDGGCIRADHDRNYTDLGIRNLHIL